MMDLQKYEEIFLESLKTSQHDSLVQLLDLDREAEISFFFELCPIQDVFQFRARYLGLKVANLLIDEKGEMRAGTVSLLLKKISDGVFSLGPKRESDSLIYGHLLHCLRTIETGEVWNWIRKFSPPLCSRKAEQAVRDTLWPEEVGSIRTHHVRRAALAAWLTLLRQGVGSCFATAPSILAQKDSGRFFKDLYELLSIGQMKRVVGGKEYAVPMCPSIGTGDLGKPIHSIENLAFSPGLIGALVAAQFLPSRESMMRKAARLKEVLQGLGEIKTAQQALRKITLAGLGLTEEEVFDEEHLSRIQIGAAIAKEGAVFYQPPSLRAQKVADWKKRLKLAHLGFQSLTECALLRIWEYSIASLCDIKTDFAKWNLYVGLGMQTEHRGGIADFLYREMDRKLQKTNGEVRKFQKLYEEAIYEVRSLEVLLRRSISDVQRYELQGQFSGAVHAAQFALDERDRCIARSDAIAEFFSILMRRYDEKLQEYFQEVFDPSVTEAEEHLFEDSPAGFRLLYKHGRSDASTWTLIYDEEGYIRSLRSFFSAVESEIEIPPALSKDFLADLTTQLIQFVQEPEFLQAAKARSTAIGRRTPWDYVSGGTMQTLVQAYYSRSQPLAEESFLFRSEEELLLMLSKLPKEQNFLIHSPTHAFTLRLDLLPENVEKCVEENRLYANKMRCGEETQEHIGHSLSEKLSSGERALFLHLFMKYPIFKNPEQLRHALLNVLQTMRSASTAVALADSHLYEQSFLLSGNAVKEALEQILRSFAPLSQDKIDLAISRLNVSFMGTFDLHRLAKSVVFEILGSPLGPIDWDEQIELAMRRLGFAPPHRMLFADTNWSGWFFGFVANPFTGQLELWRLNRIGMQGFPMAGWKKWFSPQNQLPWVLLRRTEEYI